MKISELPEPYKSLAKSLRDDSRTFFDADSIHRIHWSETPQGCGFWAAVHHAQSIRQLPPIPTPMDLAAAARWLLSELQAREDIWTLTRLNGYFAAVKAIEDAEKAGK